MKNPIRAWVAKIVREEVATMRRENNLKAFQDEINQMARNRAAQRLHDAFYKERPSDEKKRKAGWIK